MFIRSKTLKGTTYYEVVEGYRDASGRVRHRNVISLGQSPTIAGAYRDAWQRQASCRRQLKQLSQTTGEVPAAVRRKIERIERALAQQQARLDALRLLVQRPLR
jgi:hypothetical protein